MVGETNETLTPAARPLGPVDPPSEVCRFRLRVDLVGAEPPIWRRLEMRGDLRLDQVHDVLQHAFGWTDSHLHAFRVGEEARIERFVTEADLEEGEDGRLESDVRLDQVVADEGDQLYYEYDFGDCWEHALVVEAVLPAEHGRPAASVVGGQRACPPEDCGGIPGYHEILDALADSGAVDDWTRERLDLLPEGFDPTEFDVAAHDAAVRAASGS